jgi:hypothetical protein
VKRTGISIEKTEITDFLALKEISQKEKNKTKIIDDLKNDKVQGSIII